jgi:hypothetical protein
MSRFAAAPLVLAALALSACGQGQSSSADKFTGEQQRVAQAVEDLQSAGASRDEAELCSRVLAKDLVDRLAAGTRSCTQEVERALGDADEFDLTVQSVQVSGTTATARVKDGRDRVQTLRLVREGSDWKVAALA